MHAISHQEGQPDSKTASGMYQDKAVVGPVCWSPFGVRVQLVSKSKGGLAMRVLVGGNRGDVRAVLVLYLRAAGRKGGGK